MPAQPAYSGNFWSASEPAVDLDNRASIIAWLEWNDPNGIYSDEASAIEEYSPLTLAGALRLYRGQSGRD